MKFLAEFVIRPTCARQTDAFTLEGMNVKMQSKEMNIKLSITKQIRTPSHGNTKMLANDLHRLKRINREAFEI